MDNRTPPTIEDFPFRATEKLRFGDMDRQGHVNNVAYMSFFETGRVELLYDVKAPIIPTHMAFVVAKIAIEFHAEMLWPGEVLVGTRIGRIGRSSAGIEQAIFQNGRCCAIADSVVVLTDTKTRRSTPLPEETIAAFQAGLAPSAGQDA
ncbi:acyl-CoA thioesterase [Fulvimarina manganoxydans]|uniref:acyl-CoA thioesterase n=1 Tax=Fulvimarina manganoxydans TaxID=937218 RepID=UPI002353F0E4|nr:thioesterase family protein [Fulvimarina manganoxydans]